METKIQNNIIDYFTFFEEFNHSTKTCLKVCQNCAISINKSILRCKHIKEAEVIVTPLEYFAGLQNKLLTSLYNLISKEVIEIQKELLKLEELFEKLCQKNSILQESCRNLPEVLSQQSRLITGTPLQPPLNQLLNFASETVTFGSQICAQIEISLNVLSFKGLNTEHFLDNFKFPSNWNNRISEIIAYTSFCAENKL